MVMPNNKQEDAGAHWYTYANMPNAGAHWYTNAGAHWYTYTITMTTRDHYAAGDFPTPNLHTDTFQA